MNGNPMVLDELREAILLAEEAYHGISDSLVAHMVHRLQRYEPAWKHNVRISPLFCPLIIQRFPRFFFFLFVCFILVQFLHEQDGLLLSLEPR